MAENKTAAARMCVQPVAQSIKNLPRAAQVPDQGGRE